MTKSRKKMIISFISGIFIIITFSLGFALLNGGSISKISQVDSISDRDQKSYEILTKFLAAPVLFEHTLYSGDYGSQSFGNGYLDISSGCSIDAGYTGPLYTVEFRANELSVLWQRSTKRETNLVGDWEVSVPLRGSVSSNLFSLTGNSSDLLCHLKDLSYSISHDSGNTYIINSKNFKELVSLRNSEEIKMLLKSIGQDESDIIKTLKQGYYDLDSMVTPIESVVLEEITKDSLRIAVIGNSNRILEEIMLRRTSSRTVSTPSPIIYRENNTIEILKMFGIK